MSEAPAPSAEDDAFPFRVLEDRYREDCREQFRYSVSVPHDAFPEHHRQQKDDGRVEDEAAEDVQDERFLCAFRGIEIGGDDGADGDGAEAPGEFRHRAHRVVYCHSVGVEQLENRSPDGEQQEEYDDAAHEIDERSRAEIILQVVGVLCAVATPVQRLQAVGGAEEYGDGERGDVIQQGEGVHGDVAHRADENVVQVSRAERRREFRDELG